MKVLYCLHREIIILILLAPVALLTDQPVSGQGLKVNKKMIIQGESKSPQLSGKVLEVLFDGFADLYYQVDSQGYYYIIDHEGRLFTLVVPFQNKGELNEETESALEGIIKLLCTIMSQVPAINERLDAFVPGRTELVKLMHDYHVAITGSAEGIVYELAPPLFVPKVALFAAFNADYVSPGGQTDMDGYNFSPAFYPSAGISVSSVLPRINPGLNLTIDLSLGKRYLYGFRKDENPLLPATTVYYENHLHNLLITTDLLVGYNFHIGNIRTIVSGGVCARSVLSDTSRSDIDVCYYGLIVSESYDYSTEESTSLGVALSLELDFNLFGIIPVATAVKYNRYLASPAYYNYNSVNMSIGIKL